jgi:hypothetical protein
MGVINLPELARIESSLEACLGSLKKMQENMESTWPVAPADDYFQILQAVGRVNEVLEQLQKIIREKKGRV